MQANFVTEKDLAIYDKSAIMSWGMLFDNMPDFPSVHDLQVKVTGYIESDSPFVKKVHGIAPGPVYTGIVDIDGYVQYVMTSDYTHFASSVNTGALTTGITQIYDCIQGTGVSTLGSQEIPNFWPATLFYTDNSGSDKRIRVNYIYQNDNVTAETLYEHTFPCNGSNSLLVHYNKNIIRAHGNTMYAHKFDTSLTQTDSIAFSEPPAIACNNTNVVAVADNYVNVYTMYAYDFVPAVSLNAGESGHPCVAVAISPGGTYLAALYLDGTTKLKMWEKINDTYVLQDTPAAMNIDYTSAGQLTYSANGRFLVAMNPAGLANTAIKVFDLQQKRTLASELPAISFKRFKPVSGTKFLLTSANLAYESKAIKVELK
jgi:hypothetical protein